MQANYVQRLRFIFAKDGPTRYIGHLDLARTLERSLNRARIPLAYTQGYNPRPRLQLASALPLGFTSDCEMADIWLLEKVDPADVLDGLRSKLAPGIKILHVEEVNIKAPALQALVKEAEYEVTLARDVEYEKLKQKVHLLLSSTELTRIRRGKEYDLRPLIIDLKVYQAEDCTALLSMKLDQRPGKTGRPDEVLAAMELDPMQSRIHRTQLILEDVG